MFSPANAYQQCRDKLTRKAFRSTLSALHAHWFSSAVEQIRSRWGSNSLLTDDAGESYPSVFISYAQSPEVKAWIEQSFKKDLAALGFEVFFDEDDLQYGTSFACFEQPIVEGVTFVVPINTPLYKEKYEAYFNASGQRRADAARSGVSDEALLIKQRLENAELSGTVLPIVLQADYGTLVPLFHQLYSAKIQEDNYYKVFFDLTKTFLCLADRGGQLTDERVKTLKRYWQGFERQREAIAQLPEGELDKIMALKKEKTAYQKSLAEAEISTLIDKLHTEDKRKVPERQDSCLAPTEKHLIHAVTSGQVNELATLLKRYPRFSTIRDGQQNSLCHLAIRFQQAGVLTLLLKARADVQTYNTWQFQPLHLAAYQGDEASVKKLLAYGVNLDSPGPKSRTALHVAVKQGHGALVSLLLRYGANVALADQDGRTALHLAASAGDEAISRQLIQAGAPLNVQDKGGSTALHCALTGDFMNVGALLLEYGANSNLKDSSHKTAFEIARSHGAHITYYERHKGLAAERARTMSSLVAVQLKKPQSQLDLSGRYEEWKPRDWEGLIKTLTQQLRIKNAEAPGVLELLLVGTVSLFWGENLSLMGTSRPQAERLQEAASWHQLKQQLSSGESLTVNFSDLKQAPEVIFQQAIGGKLYSEALFDYLIHYRKMDLNYHYPGQGSLLHLAVSHRQDATLIYLLNRGMNINTCTAQGSLAHIAASIGDIKILQRLTARGIDLALKNNRDETALMKAERELKKIEATQADNTDLLTGIKKSIMFLKQYEHQPFTRPARRGHTLPERRLPATPQHAQHAPEPTANASENRLPLLRDAVKEVQSASSTASVPPVAGAVKLPGMRVHNV